MKFRLNYITKNYKTFLNIKNGAQLLMNNHIETDLLLANGYSYGFELLARKNEGPAKRMD